MIFEESGVTAHITQVGKWKYKAKARLLVSRMAGLGLRSSASKSSDLSTV